MFLVLHLPEKLNGAKEGPLGPMNVNIKPYPKTTALDLELLISEHLKSENPQSPNKESSKVTSS